MNDNKLAKGIANKFKVNCNTAEIAKPKNTIILGFVVVDFSLKYI